VDAERPLDPQLERLLTVKDLRELLGCARNTVSRMQATGKLRSIKLGRAVRFHPEDVRRMIEELRR
jgi:excisionase family DNA binding protein